MAGFERRLKRKAENIPGRLRRAIPNLSDRARGSGNTTTHQGKHLVQALAQSRCPRGSGFNEQVPSLPPQWGAPGKGINGPRRPTQCWKPGWALACVLPRPRSPWGWTRCSHSSKEKTSSGSAARGPSAGGWPSCGISPEASGSKAHALFTHYFWESPSATTATNTDVSLNAMQKRVVVEAIWARSAGPQEP